MPATSVRTLRVFAAFLALVLLLGPIPMRAAPAGAFQATRLTLNAPSAIHQGDQWSAKAILTDTAGNPLGGLTLSWYLDAQFQQPSVTSSDGSSILGVGGWTPTLGNHTMSVSFNGTSSYLPSSATVIINVLQENPTTYTTTTATGTITGPVVELSRSDGSTVCPNYFRGNASGGVWDQGTLTCTLAGGGNVYPAFCVSGTPLGCVRSPIGRLVIDKNVTVVINHGGSMAIYYSDVVNYGTLISDIANYGILQNHGTIDLNETNQLLNLPYNGLGLVNNTVGATINNWYYITNAGIIDNYGTINNHGQFISQLCSPCIAGTLVNDGTYEGSLPAPVYSSTVPLTGGNGSANQNPAGITVSITGATGNKVTVSTQVQGSNAPPGLGSVQLGSTSFYDIMISGTKTGTALVCITTTGVNATTGGIEYWNGGFWVRAANQTVKGSSPTLAFCGDIPVSALTGTPLAVGPAPSTSVSTSTSTPGGKTSAITAKTGTTTGHLTASSVSSTESTSTIPLGPPPTNWLVVLSYSVVALIIVGVVVVALLRRR